MTAAQRSMAADMLASKGQTVTITRRSAGSYNPATGAATITTSTQTAKAVILPIHRKQHGEGNVPVDTRQCLLAALNTSGAALTAPKVDDFVTDAAGLVYVVAGVEPLSPAGLDIIYDCALRASV